MKDIRQVIGNKNDVAQSILDILAEEDCVQPGFEYLATMHFGLSNIINGNTVTMSNDKLKGCSLYYMLGLCDIQNNVVYKLIGIANTEQFVTIRSKFDEEFYNTLKEDNMGDFMTCIFCKNNKLFGASIYRDTISNITFIDIIQSMIGIIEDTCITAFNKQWTGKEWEDIK